MDNTARYRELFAATPHPMIVYDPESLAIRDVNPAAIAEYGYGFDEFTALTIADIRPPEDRPALRRMVNRGAGVRYAGIWRHLRRDGSVFEVEITSNDLSIDGAPLRMTLVQPVGAREAGRLAEQGALQRFTAQQASLLALATDSDLAEGRLDRALAAILRAASDALQVRRVNVWRVSRDGAGLTCLLAYDAATDSLTEGLALDATDCPAYIDAITSGRAVDAHDACNDPRTAELAESYLRPHGITSLLDATVRLHGHLYGVLCLEHVGPTRQWRPDEVRFAGELADQVTQALLNAERARYASLWRNVAAGVAAETGERFFRELVLHLTRAMDLECAYIAQLSEEGMAPMALAIDDAIVTEGPMDLDGTPNAEVLDQGEATYTHRVRDTYPTCPLLARVHAESFLGIRLSDRDGTVMGLLAVAGRRSLEASTEARVLLSIFGERAAAELARLRREAHLLRASAVFDNASEGIVVSDRDGRILEANPAFHRITGYSAHRLGVRSVFRALLPEDPHFPDRALAAIGQRGRWQGELRALRSDGERFHAWATFTELPAPRAGEPSHMVGLISDISAIRRSEAQLEHLAHHDPLTQLPNRVLLNDRLAHALDLARRHDGNVAILFLDLDGFKDVNDSLGHSEGDRLLHRVASRLQDTVRIDDTLARIGGDEFVVLMERMEGEDDIAPLVERLLDTFTDSFHVNDRDLYISASVGISLFPRDGDNPETLIQSADAAMYAAKASGKNTYRFFTPALSERAFQRVALVSALRHALAEQEFRLVYQPVIDLATGRTTGFEALLRWQRPGHGLVRPATFIPVAEDSGLIVPLGRWVIGEAARQARYWLDLGLDFGRIAVNVAVAQVTRPGFAEDFLGQLALAGVSPERLSIEITESLFLDPQAPVAEALARLRDAGVEIAIDDFGTGYSSLAYLKRLPIDTLKLDKSFTGDLPHDADDVSITRAILGLAETLSLSVVAEGIETREQRTFLQSLGCARGQGYLFGRPTLPDDCQRVRA